MKLSSNTNELFAALCLAQAKIIDPRKNVESQDAKGEKFKTAPLSKFFDNITREFKKNGLFYSQNLIANAINKIVGVSTFIGHSSGQWIEGDVFEVAYKDDEQGLAVYIAKSASIQALVGITGKNAIEVPEGVINAQNQYASAEERRNKKQAMLGAIKLVETSAGLDMFMANHSPDIEKMTIEDADYVSDITREIKRLKNKFASEGENLAKQI